MDIKHHLCCMILLFITFTTSTLASGGRDEMIHSTGRNILQAIEPCPVNFEILDYSNLTSQCKQPWDVQPCCDAFKDLACPHANELNDMRTDCAAKMFGYLGLLHYPAGLFTNICTKTKEGIPCPENITQTDEPSVDRRQSSPSRELMIFATTFLLLLGILGS